MEKSSPTRDNNKLASDVKVLANNVIKTVPFAEYEFKTVTFPQTPRVDMDITHSLKVREPETIRWMVVGWGFASAPAESPFVYKDTSASRKPWTPSVIRLRCNVGAATCRLLLFSEVTK